jgi:hypothetical protein
MSLAELNFSYLIFAIVPLMLPKSWKPYLVTYAVAIGSTNVRSANPKQAAACTLSPRQGHFDMPISQSTKLTLKKYDRRSPKMSEPTEPLLQLPPREVAEGLAALGLGSRKLLPKGHPARRRSAPSTKGGSSSRAAPDEGRPSGEVDVLPGGGAAGMAAALARRLHDQEALCGRCGTTARLSKSGKLSKCTSCGVVWYCGTMCQKADWPAHKVMCRNVQTAPAVTLNHIMKEYNTDMV